MVERIMLDEFRARLRAQGVPTKEDVAFKCPMCATVQTIGDMMDLGKSREDAERMIGFGCIGRITGAGPSEDGRPKPGTTGCDWSLGGLFKMHRLEVVDEDGGIRPLFEICDQAEAQQHAMARAERKQAAA